MRLHQVIQGGMGAAVSDWRLARAVSTQGELGVVSGTGLDQVLARRLQTGDPGGHMRRALAAFPDRAIADDVLARYFIRGGKGSDAPFRRLPIASHERNRELDRLCLVANFAEVYLAKEGHDGTLGVNYLHKIQPPFLPSLYGALLAGVDVVLVGAGIPLDVPEILDALCAHRPVARRIHIPASRSPAPHEFRFDPRDTLPGDGPPLRRPRFFPIVSSATLAAMLVRKRPGSIDGVVVEVHSAGGHNAPPRGAGALSAIGEPIYGARDVVDLAAMRELGVPFWLAGACGSPDRLATARAAGAAGIQVGTLFAFCEESGLRDDLKREVIGAAGDLDVFTDPLASPTGFPFKILAIPDTMADAQNYRLRPRRCDLGFLREAYEKPDGTLAWRCPAEHPDAYVGKGGKREDTAGRKCLCNGLLANIGLPQVRANRYVEPPLLTCGDDLSVIARALAHAHGPDKTTYSAAEALAYLLSAAHPAALDEAPTTAASTDASSASVRPRAGTNSRPE